MTLTLSLSITAKVCYRNKVESWYFILNIVCVLLSIVVVIVMLKTQHE